MVVSNISQHSDSVQNPNAAPQKQSVSNSQPLKIDASNSQPLVSVMLVIKNGMPFLKEAIASVANQTYRNFELVVQDGVSTDDSVEFLKNFDGIPTISIESAPDNGPNQAYNRAVHRCKGSIIGSIASDDMLEPDALENAVRLFAEHPHAAVIYGGCKMMDQSGQITSTFHPDPFDLLRVMSCEVVPPFSASFFSKTVCGDNLYFDESFFNELELWLRLSHLPILTTDTIFSRVRLRTTSITGNIQIYERTCEDKIQAVKHYLSQYGPSPLTNELYRYAASGVYAWVAESMLWIPTGSEDSFNYYFEKARALYPYSERLKMIKLHQQFNSTQTELFQTRDKINEVQYQLDRSQDRLNTIQDELHKEVAKSQDELRREVAKSNEKIGQLSEIIKAMESSKFWQIRTKWMNLKKRIGLREDRK